MDVTVSQAQGKVTVTILRTHGELDASNYQDLIFEAQRLYREGVRNLLVDLRDTPYMSSSGLIALQSIASLLRGEELQGPEADWVRSRSMDQDRETGLEAHLKLLHPQPRVHHVLEMVGFTRFLEVYADLEAAVASF